MNDFNVLANANTDVVKGLVDLDKQEVSSKISHQAKRTSSVVVKYLVIARGAVKKVWVAKRPNSHGGESNQLPNTVFYTAIPSLFKRKEKELKDEVQKMRDIAKNVTDKIGSTENLAVEITLEGRLINGQYTVEVPKAERDFEKEIRDPKTTLKARIAFGGQLLKGMANLHLANFFYGDPKAENSMIYERENPITKERERILKVGDFGKAQQVSNPNETKSYKGNSRHCPPERVASQKGDVYGTAIDLIRNLEEPILNENKWTTLISTDRSFFDQKVSSKVRGVEAYVVEHRDIPASNPGISLRSLINRLKFGNPKKNDMVKHQNAIHAYINKLQEGYNKLIEEKKIDGFTEADVKQLCDLLKKMTVASPKERISMEAASSQYEKIQAKINHRK